MERAPRFFVWVLPILWGACSLAQSRVPGDEYGFYVVSSLPAVWIAPLLLLGHVSFEAMVVPVLLAGAPVLAGLGWVMDRLQVGKVLWVVLDLGGGLAVLFLTLHSFPRLERAVGKNGSLGAYLVLSACVGLYLSVILSIVLTSLARVVKGLTTVLRETRRGIEESRRAEP